VYTAYIRQLLIYVPDISELNEHLDNVGLPPIDNAATLAAMFDQVNRVVFAPYYGMGYCAIQEGGPEMFAEWMLNEPGPDIIRQYCNREVNVCFHLCQSHVLSNYMYEDIDCNRDCGYLLSSCSYISNANELASRFGMVMWVFESAYGTLTTTMVARSLYPLLNATILRDFIDCTLASFNPATSLAEPFATCLVEQGCNNNNNNNMPEYGTECCGTSLLPCNQTNTSSITSNSDSSAGQCHYALNMTPVTQTLFGTDAYLSLGWVDPLDTEGMITCAPCIVVTTDHTHYSVAGMGHISQQWGDPNATCDGLVSLTMTLEFMANNARANISITHITGCGANESVIWLRANITVVHVTPCDLMTDAYTENDCPIILECPSDSSSTTTASSTIESSDSDSECTSDDDANEYVTPNSCAVSTCVERVVVDTEVICDDNNACTVDTCNATTGLCEYTVVMPNIPSPNPCYEYICIDCTQEYALTDICANLSNVEVYSRRHQKAFANHMPTRLLSRDTPGVVFWLASSGYNLDQNPYASYNDCLLYHCDNQTGEIASTPKPDETLCNVGFDPCNVNVCRGGECTAIAPLDCADHYLAVASIASRSFTIAMSTVGGFVSILLLGGVVWFALTSVTTKKVPKMTTLVGNQLPDIPDAPTN
jgi:hypothetical protein